MLPEYVLYAYIPECSQNWLYAVCLYEKGKHLFSQQATLVQVTDEEQSEMIKYDEGHIFPDKLSITHRIFDDTVQELWCANGIETIFLREQGLRLKSWSGCSWTRLFKQEKIAYFDDSCKNTWFPDLRLRYFGYRKYRLTLEIDESMVSVFQRWKTLIVQRNDIIAVVSSLAKDQCRTQVCFRTKTQDVLLFSRFNWTLSGWTVTGEPMNDYMWTWGICKGLAAFLGVQWLDEIDV